MNSIVLIRGILSLTVEDTEDNRLTSLNGGVLLQSPFASHFVVLQ